MKIISLSFMGPTFLGLLMLIIGIYDGGNSAIMGLICFPISVGVGVLFSTTDGSGSGGSGSGSCSSGDGGGGCGGGCGGGE